MSSTQNAAKIDIAIIGGGFSGTLVAVHLLRRCENLSLAILDRNNKPGRGLAYSSAHRFHLLNVPAGNMSALQEEPDHFLRWTRRNHDASVQGRSFLPRSLYGDYAQDLLNQSVRERRQNQTYRIEDEALSACRIGDHFSIQRRNGPDIHAEMIVLATGNFPPADPKVPGLTPSSTLYRPIAWSPNALEELPSDGSVLLIGSGLTSIDQIMALKSRGFQGTIHVLSRKGLVPQRHRPTETWRLFWNDNSPRTTRGLLRLVRCEVVRAAEQGVDWRSIFDVLRPVTQQIWLSLPWEEKRRFLRHLRSYWEVHRHRLAPEIADLLADMQADGQVRFHAGRLIRYRESGTIATLSYRARHSRRKSSLKVNRVINCTGSETDCRRIGDSLLCSLFAQGLARPDPLALGIDADEYGALLDHHGVTSQSLFTLGPTRKGSLWETTAVPEIRSQAANLGEYLATVLTNRRNSTRTAVQTAV